MNLTVQYNEDSRDFEVLYNYGVMMGQEQCRGECECNLREQAERQEPVAWIEGPHGALRANPDYRFQGPQAVAWSFPLYLHAAPADAEYWHRIADERAAEIVRLMSAPADAVEALRKIIAAGYGRQRHNPITDEMHEALQYARAALAAADQKEPPRA